MMMMIFISLIRVYTLLISHFSNHLGTSTCETEREGMQG